MPHAASPRGRTRAAARRGFLRSAVAALALAAAPYALAADVPMPAGLSAPAQPTVMPAFELPTTAGKPLDSASLQGQVVVIRFWAAW